MKTHAKQTGKLNGTSSLMVLGILFLTVLPLLNAEAGNCEKADNSSLVESYLPIETWMLILTDWNTDVLVAKAEDAVKVEDWMLRPENWDNDFQAELAEASDADLKLLDDWMFEPVEWRCDLAGLGHAVSDQDLVMLPFCF